MTKKFFSCCFFLIAAITLSVCLSNINPVANADNELEVEETVIDNALRIGRYYLNGDTSSSYFEVYDDGTLQWHNFDFEGYLKELNDKYDRENGIVPDENLKIAREKAMNDEIEWVSARHNYTVVHYSIMDTTSIELEYDPKSECRRGYNYIDNKTIKVSDDLCFFFVEYNNG